MRLSAEEKSILDGERGEAARIALSVLVDLGQLFGAKELMRVSQVHIDATLYMVEAGLEFAEKMVDLGAKVAVPTSLNPSAIDLQRWEQFRVPVEILPKHKRPISTCGPLPRGPLLPTNMGSFLDSANRLPGAALILPAVPSMTPAMSSSGRAWRVRCWRFPLAKGRAPVRSLCWNWSG